MVRSTHLLSPADRQTGSQSALPSPFVYLTRLFRSLSLSPSLTLPPPHFYPNVQCGMQCSPLPPFSCPSLFPSAKRFPMVNHNARARTRISHSHEGAAGTYVAYAAFGLILCTHGGLEYIVDGILGSTP